jgi:hypothetical protein
MSVLMICFVKSEKSVLASLIGDVWPGLTNPPSFPIASFAQNQKRSDCDGGGHGTERRLKNRAAAHRPLHRCLPNWLACQLTPADELNKRAIATPTGAPWSAKDRRPGACRYSTPEVAFRKKPRRDLDGGA